MVYLWSNASTLGFSGLQRLAVKIRPLVAAGQAGHLEVLLPKELFPVVPWSLARQ